MYFYNLGHKLGSEAILYYAKLFGLDKKAILIYLAKLKDLFLAMNGRKDLMELNGLLGILLIYR